LSVGYSKRAYRLGFRKEKKEEICEKAFSKYIGCEHIYLSAHKLLKNWFMVSKKRIKFAMLQYYYCSTSSLSLQSIYMAHT